MAPNLKAQVADITRVCDAVTEGNLSQKVDIDVTDELLPLKESVNRMVEQLSAVASEVNRVTRELGSQGILGSQAQLPTANGAWKARILCFPENNVSLQAINQDLRDNVNRVSNNVSVAAKIQAFCTLSVHSV